VDFGTSRWVGANVRLHQPRDWLEGGMAALRAAARSMGSLRDAAALIAAQRKDGR
jgi:hypothetical protein